MDHSQKMLSFLGKKSDPPLLKNEMRLLTSHNLMEFITKTSHVNSSGNIIVFNPGALTNLTTGGLAPPRPPLLILVAS